MITSTKNYTKKKKKKGTDRTLGKIAKAKLYRENHTKKHTHTHALTKREKGKKYIDIYLKKGRKQPNQ